MKKTKLVFEGHAVSDGIFLHSKKDSNLSYYTYYDEDGDIRTSPLQKFWYENEKRKELSKGEKFPTNPIAVTGLVILLLFNMIFLRSGNFNIAFGLLFLGNAIYPLTNIIKFLWLSKSENSCWHNLAKYHTAKHMAINAYNKYHRLPTFEEVQKSSKFSETCELLGDVNHVVYYFFFSMIVISLYNINPSFYLIILSSYFVLMIMVRKYGLLKFMEVIYTVPASEKEIKLTIAALEHYIQNEEKAMSNLDKEI